MSPRWVDVEVVFLGVRAGGGLCHRVRRRALGRQERPDRVALTVAGPEVEVVHSTSWRCEDDGRVVLTYVAVSDPDPAAGAVDLSAPAVVCSGDPLRPSPPGLHSHHVAAHAVRHLADLLHRDPGIAEAVRTSRCPEVWQAVARVSVGMPTGTHEQAHLDAGGPDVVSIRARSATAPTSRSR